MSLSSVRILRVAIVVVLVVHSQCAARCAAAALDAAVSVPDPPCHKAHQSAPSETDTSHHRADGCGQAAAAESKGTPILKAALDSASLVLGDLSISLVYSKFDFASYAFSKFWSPPPLRLTLRI